MDKITVSSLLSWKPCGWNKEDDGKNYTPRRVSELFESAGIAEADPLEFINGAQGQNVPPADILWVILRPEVLPERDLHELACQYALWSLHFFEDTYPNDDRPRKAIEAKQKWLRGEITNEELKAAAEAAAWSARAARAAWAAAEAAAWSAWAARAAWAAAEAAEAAAWAAEAAAVTLKAARAIAMMTAMTAWTEGTAGTATVMGAAALLQITVEYIAAKKTN